MREMEQTWQKKYSKMKDSFLYLFDEGLYTDCSFIVGLKDKKKVVKAHKLVLIQASCVYEELFYGKGRTETDIIEKPDVDPDIFQMFMRSIYSETISLNTLNQAFDVYFLAYETEMSWIMENCIDYIWRNTDQSNAVEVFEFLIIFGSKEKVDRCKKLFVKHTSDYFESRVLAKMEKSTLLTILSEDSLDVESEVAVYNAAVKWIQEYLQKQGQNIDKNQKQLLYKEIMSHVRFLNMSPVEFSNGPASEPYLEPKDALAILSNLTSDRNSNIPYPSYFSKKKRTFTLKRSLVENHAFSADYKSYDCDNSQYYSTEYDSSPPWEQPSDMPRKQLALEGSFKRPLGSERSYSFKNEPDLHLGYSPKNQLALKEASERHLCLEQLSVKMIGSPHLNYERKCYYESHPLERQMETLSLRNVPHSVYYGGKEETNLIEPRRRVYEIENAQSESSKYNVVERGVVHSLESVDVTSRDEYGWSILHKAVHEGDIGKVKWLLANFPEIDLDLATTRGNGERPGGSTALHLAAWNGNAQLVEILLAHGATRNIKDHRCKTQLQRAKSRGHSQVVQLLKS